MTVKWQEETKRILFEMTFQLLMLLQPSNNLKGSYLKLNLGGLIKSEMLFPQQCSCLQDF